MQSKPINGIILKNENNKIFKKLDYLAKTHGILFSQIKERNLHFLCQPIRAKVKRTPTSDGLKDEAILQLGDSEDEEKRVPCAGDALCR